MRTPFGPKYILYSYMEPLGVPVCTNKVDRRGTGRRS